MSILDIDFRDLKCPSRGVIEALNAYVADGENRGRATFAIPVVEVGADSRPTSEPVVMLTASITDDEITLIGEGPLKSKHLVIQLPFHDSSETNVEIIRQSEFRTAWILTGRLHAIGTPGHDPSE